MLKTIDAGVLKIAYRELGPQNGWPLILLHGFPYDIHAYERAALLLAAKGARIFIPYMRGFGATTFLDENTPRSGQQAAIGHDLLAFITALNLDGACLVGYDWGSRAACVVAALWPERVTGLVTVGSYTIQDIASSTKPAAPETESRYWYQYYFHSERGRNGLKEHRQALCRLLWQQWSPEWKFSGAEFDNTAASFENPDFVDVVIHSYRHRHGLVQGDPVYEQSEAELAKLPPIVVPTFALDGGADGLALSGTSSHAKHFVGAYHYRSVPGAGHNLPQEKPDELVKAVLQLLESKAIH